MQYNAAMRLRPATLMDLAGLFTVGAVAAISFVSVDDPAGRWLAVGLCLAFAALQFLHPSKLTVAALHGYFLAQTLLAVGLLLTQPNAFAAPILFFVLSAEVMTTLPLRGAVGWISAFLVITYLQAVFTSDWLSAVFFALPYAGGYLFFGTFGKALSDAQAARQESQRLLGELRAAQAQLQELAVAEERNRLARELHDALGHRLTVAVVQLEGAQRLIPTDPERAGRMIGAMREQMKEALGDLRRSVADLRAPRAADDGPLAAALERLARDFQDTTGLAVELRQPAAGPALSEPQRLALYRTAQEGLTNAHKHAGARTVWLELAYADGQAVLTVADDGRGWPAETPDAGFGLTGLRERAAQLGGAVTLAPRPGGGAQMRLAVPLAEGRPR